MSTGPTFSTAAVDVDGGAALAPAVADTPKRRRGRPPGSRTRVSHTHVGSDEFALLRAVAQGVDLSVAARQYLHWPGRLPERAALVQHYADLLLRIEAAADGLDDAPLARAMARTLRNSQVLDIETGSAPTAVGQEQVAPAIDPAPLTSSAPPAAKAPAPTVPSLEEFSAQFDDDMFSESELVERYLEAFPQEAPSAAVEPAPQEVLELSGPSDPEAAVVAPLQEGTSAIARMTQLLDAINWLDARLGARPERDHRVEQWVRFSDAQRQALHSVGVITLGNLIDWMCLRGRKWVSLLPGYGQKRAESLLLWLQRSELVPAAGLPALPSFALEKQDPDPLQPLHAMRWPTELDGHDGVFRTPFPNTMNASNDQEAVAGWFKSIKDKSPHTQEAYQRAIERLILWAIVEKKTALSSLNEADITEFRAFLRDPPAHWIQAPKTNELKRAPAWRPLRGPLNKQSLLLTFSAVSAMFSHWRASAYTYVNSAEKVKGKKGQEMEMDVFRSFTKADLKVLGDTFSDLPDGPAKRRLRAILLILENGGLRRAELASAYWSDLKSDRVDGERTAERVLHVKGKGQRERKVPLNAEVLEALETHREDRIRLMQEMDEKRNKEGLFSRVKPEDMPLIGVLDDKWLVTKDKQVKEKVIQQLTAGTGSQRLPSPPADAQGNYLVLPSEPGLVLYASSRKGALSGKMIYQVLKEFFGQCSVAAGEKLNDPEAPFQRASTHWLRHTFAHKMLTIQTLEPAKLLPLVQALMGHKSINTTAIYVKADMTERIRAVDQMKGSV